MTSQSPAAASSTRMARHSRLMWADASSQMATMALMSTGPQKVLSFNGKIRRAQTALAAKVMDAQNTGKRNDHQHKQPRN